MWLQCATDVLHKNAASLFQYENNILKLHIISDTFTMSWIWEWRIKTQHYESHFYNELKAE